MTTLPPIPRIAIYQPHADDEFLMRKLFSGERYSVREVSSVEDLLTLVADEGSPFDAIILPPRSVTDDGGLWFCSQIRTVAQLDATPIAALLTAREISGASSFISTGADIILSEPFDASTMHSQIAALKRLSTRIVEQTAIRLEQEGLSHTSTAALNCVREGILLYDRARVPLFLNTAAGRLLGISWETDAEAVDRVYRQFATVIDEHERQRSDERDMISHLPVSVVRCEILRADRQPIDVAIRVLSLTTPSKEHYGTAIALTDMSELSLLSAQLMLEHRIRSLALLALTAVVVLNPEAKRSASDALSQLPRLSAPTSSVAATISPLLEFLDVTLPPTITVKLKQLSPTPLAVPFSDLFQLLGQLLLDGVDYVGTSGVVEVDCREATPGFVEIAVRSMTDRTIPFAHADHFSALLERTFEIAQGESKITLGVKAAQTIADKYQQKIVRRSPESFTEVVTVSLPMAR